MDDQIGNNTSLCDALDRMLNKGVAIHGDIKISVAGVDLLYIGLRGLLCAVDALDGTPASFHCTPTSSIAPGVQQ